MSDDTKIFAAQGLAKSDKSGDQVYWGSPLAVIGLFMEVVRARFSAPNELPWRWRDDPRRRDEDDGSNEHPFPILIESELMDDPEARSGIPAIYVGVDDIRYTQIVVGDKYAHHMPTRDLWYHAHESVPVVLNCVSSNRGEAAILGDIVYRHILSGKQLIRETFDIHAIDGPTLGKTQPFRRAAENPDGWTSPVTFTCTLNVRWHVKPYAPVLQGILLKLSADGRDFTTNAIRIVMKQGSDK